MLDFFDFTLGDLCETCEDGSKRFELDYLLTLHGLDATSLCPQALEREVREEIPFEEYDPDMDDMFAEYCKFHPVEA